MHNWCLHVILIKHITIHKFYLGKIRYSFVLFSTFLKILTHAYNQYSIQFGYVLIGLHY